ncbi:MAG: DUF1350 family protein [Cyanobacteriota bacterium]|nr:DUF1350 family protein [Cyanobacteriota bacterium]
MVTLSWQAIGDLWILRPARPRAVLYFLGGAFIGSAPQFFYDALLNSLARSGYWVLATPYLTTPDHASIAQTILSTWRRAETGLGLGSLPRFGLGHSLGCKLHLLCCVADPDYTDHCYGNIFMAYSNASLPDALPWGLGIPSLDFSPSPATTVQLIAHHYQVVPHLLVKFQDDTIDDTEALEGSLKKRCGSAICRVNLPGNHGTSVGQSYPFRIENAFSPVDVLGQWIYQSVNSHNQILVNTLNYWIQQQLRNSEYTWKP